MKNYTAHLLSLVFLLTLLTPSCAPVFSDLQSARTVGKGQHEITPGYSSVGFSSDGESDGVQNELSFNYAFGLSDKVDLRFRYFYVWGKGDDASFGDNINAIGIGPKISLVEDRVAVFLPLGLPFGDGVEDASLQFHPTILLTQPLVPEKLDLTLGAKYITVFEEDAEGLVAFNLGAAFSTTNVRDWAVRLEYGRLFNPGEMGSYGQFSLGFSKAFGPNNFSKR